MKFKRHAEIIDLIGRYEIETQEELVKKLTERGYNVTQTTVSRDIKELKLSKVDTGNGRRKYSAAPGRDMAMATKYARVLHDGYVSSGTASSLVVIHTVSGMAMAVAAAIDHMGIPGMVGCIAGDDTIMCAVSSAEDGEKALAYLRKVVAEAHQSLE
ncbi:MAG: arginine repressor [Lachnospiraceae bacterium]|nr:arginine repressor [Lachnospiraceae bacterium]